MEFEANMIDFSNQINQVLFVIALLGVFVTFVISIILVIKNRKSAKQLFCQKLIPYVNEKNEKCKNKYLWDMDLLLYSDEQAKEVYYCSVMGRAGLHKAIAIYQGEQIHKFLELAQNKYPEHMLINYQECFTCQFSKREETLSQNRNIIKELGLSFRGTWILLKTSKKDMSQVY